MKQEYIKVINEAMQATDDIALLDLIFKLLIKSETTE